MKIGISLYLGSGYEKNRQMIKKARNSHVEYAFTSLHIPEEAGFNHQKEIEKLLDECKEAGIHLIADISQRTLTKLGCRSFDDLARTSVSCVRLDDGFDNKEISDFTHSFHVVLNASTIGTDEIQELKNLGADLSHVTACHNFYPKPLTGLSIGRVKQINQRVKQHGLVTMGFVAGDLERRGPLFEGLPTLEEDRTGDVFANILKLHESTDMDIVLIGDIDVNERVWEQIREYHEGFISLHAYVDSEYLFIKDTLHHDRPDSSDYVIRSVESRAYQEIYKKAGEMERPAGSITIGNGEYLRYNGELEIARVGLRPEGRVNIIGNIRDEDLVYLPYIKDGFGFVIR